MNRSVDPCEDFYQFACGTFLNEAGVFKPVQMTFIDTNKELYNKKYEIITEPTQLNEINSIKMAKSLYNSCMKIGNCWKINL